MLMQLLTLINSDLGNRLHDRWISGDGKSLFDLFPPAGATGIYSITNVTDKPIQDMDWFTLIKSTERMTIIHDNGIYTAKSQASTWMKTWIKL